MEVTAVGALQLPIQATWPMPLLLAVVAGFVVRFFFVHRGPKVHPDTKGTQQEDRTDGGHRLLCPEQVEECFRRLGAPRHVHEEGTFIPSSGLLINNAAEATTFENETCRGNFLSLHRATHDKRLDKSGEYPWGDYFKQKSRLWEARVQLQFKVAPKAEDLYFGVEIAEYVPMAGVAKRTLELAVRALKGAVGPQVYHTVGDDPKTVEGPLERPAFMMPLWAFDQIIVTPEGDVPPKLTDPGIPSMGFRRYQRVREYRNEVKQLEFKVGPTYTFCFWGISRFLDKLNWQLRLPLSPMPISFDTFCGRPPVSVVMYTLKPAATVGETRHLQCRKNYYLNVAFWSSQHRPNPQQLDGMMHLSQQMPAPTEAASAAVRGHRRERSHTRKGNLRNRVLRCCAPLFSTHA